MRRVEGAPADMEGAFQAPRTIPWAAGAGGLESVLRRWRSDRQLWPHFALDHLVPATPGETAPFPEDLAPGVRRALGRRGIQQLYAHQAEAAALARAGRDVVV